MKKYILVLISLICMSPLYGNNSDRFVKQDSREILNHVSTMSPCEQIVFKNQLSVVRLNSLGLFLFGLALLVISFLGLQKNRRDNADFYGVLIVCMVSAMFSGLFLFRSFDLLVFDTWYAWQQMVELGF